MQTGPLPKSIHLEISKMEYRNETNKFFICYKEKERLNEDRIPRTETDIT